MPPLSEALTVGPDAVAVRACVPWVVGGVGEVLAKDFSYYYNYEFVFLKKMVCVRLFWFDLNSVWQTNGFSPDVFVFLPCLRGPRSP